jgi:catechol 2,3-dioxygenase-like lactoylglutathione lyase family enzyme
MLQVKALDHVGLKVKDLDQTLNFYSRLGLTVLRTKGPDTDGLRAAVIQVGRQELNIFCHPGYASSREDNAAGIDHFCFEVDAASIEDVISELRRTGIEIVRGPTKRRDGSSLLLHDPDGVRVELQLKNRLTTVVNAGEHYDTSTRQLAGADGNDVDA